MRNKFLGTGEPGYHPLRKIKIVLSGLRYAIVYDFSVAYKIIVSLFVLVVAFIFRQWLDFAMVLMATALVLMAEMFNSAIEAICDFVELRQDERIKVIKDIAAAAAGISIFVWVVVLIIEGSHLWQIFVATYD